MFSRKTGLKKLANSEPGAKVFNIFPKVVSSSLGFVVAIRGHLRSL